MFQSFQYPGPLPRTVPDACIAGSQYVLVESLSITFLHREREREMKLMLNKWGLACHLSHPMNIHPTCLFNSKAFTVSLLNESVSQSVS